MAFWVALGHHPSCLATLQMTRLPLALDKGCLADPPPACPTRTKVGGAKCMVSTKYLRFALPRFTRTENDPNRCWKG